MTGDESATRVVEGKDSESKGMNRGWEMIREMVKGKGSGPQALRLMRALPLLSD
jgi:hypothetical protein